MLRIDTVLGKKELMEMVRELKLTCRKHHLVSCAECERAVFEDSTESTPPAKEA